MKFVVICKQVDGETTWEEPYDKPEVTDPETWAKETVEWFNSTLRPHEKPRELVAVRIEGESQTHHWTKSSLTTQFNTHGRQYDAYRCEKCGITGKRFTLDGGITPDSKYRSSRFSVCPPRPARPRKKP